MDFLNEFSDISKHFNLSSTEGKINCHKKCHEYAKKEISNILRRNEFMQFCAEKLLLPWIHEEIFPTINGGETILLDVNDNRVIICANKPGLRYLSSVATTLANSNLSGEHIHVEHDDEVKIISDYEFEFIYRDDDWFKKIEKRNNQERLFLERNVKSDEIAAIIFQSPIPENYLSNIEQFEIYEVLGAEPLIETAPSKKIRENSERMLNVTIKCKDDSVFSINIDMDDLEIVLLTNAQLQRLKIKKNA